MLDAISASEIATSGLKAQRIRMDIIANNLANVGTTRTEGGGGAFRRQMVLLRGEPLGRLGTGASGGVEVKRIVSDDSPLRPVYGPSHPDANADGFVNYPNIDTAVEMVDLIAAQRAYEANIAVLANGRRMKQQALRIIEK